MEQKLFGHPPRVGRALGLGSLTGLVAFALLILGEVALSYWPWTHPLLSWPFPRPPDANSVSAAASTVAAVGAVIGVAFTVRHSTAALRQSANASQRALEQSATNSREALNHAARALEDERTRARKAASLESIWRLTDRWGSREMIARRELVAAQLLEKRPLRRRALLEILNEFEMLGYLVNRAEVLEVGEAWDNFSSWALPYWYAAQPDIEQMRLKDKTVYTLFEAVVHQFEEYEAAILEVSPESVATAYRSNWTHTMATEASLLGTE